MVYCAKEWPMLCRVALIAAVLAGGTGMAWGQADEQAAPAETATQPVGESDKGGDSFLERDTLTNN
jgi:hypothetical protein